MVEVLSEIFSWLQTGEDTIEGVDYRSLAALARTCRSFKEPALDALWAYIYQLPRLIRSLPESVLERNSKKEVVGVRPLAPNEWSRLYSYSSRVKDVAISEVHPTRNFILHLLASPPPDMGFMFPKLRRLLVVDEKGSLRFPEYRFLLGPHIIDLEYTLGWNPSVNDDVTKAIIASLPEVCPNIRHLQVIWKIYHAADWAVDVISETAPQLKSLEELICPMLNTYGMTQVSQLASLQYLVLEESVTDLAQGANDVYEFANLEFLGVTLWDLAKMTSFFQLLERLPGSFAAHVHTSPSLPALESFFCDIPRNNLNVHNVEVVYERASMDSFWPMGRIHRHHGPSITIHTFTPLRQFSSLRSLDIEVTIPISLSDADIEDLSLAWPNLVDIRLNEKNLWGEGILSVTGLEILIRNCDLAYIGLSLDASKLYGLPREYPADGYANDIVPTLPVSDSRIGDPVTLSLLLACLFTAKSFAPRVEKFPVHPLEVIRHETSVAACIREIREMERDDKAFWRKWPPGEEVMETLREICEREIRR
ncbi:hypothetical protein CONPUDRAFT_167593 [Coniophora puteana RWD-64-598 SS2]|uniref:F-box domain-containing protein n=1 Tax=Coniophora puteana (strain RWD-64-598) TaxID=741705 RepID=A0A5M3MI65_CONPW|nr:uncharacterized protein CONPUDRAFT_167593 [Coniophora puteana RWD-64-598 SS2]EIW78620.1 hypothetical protein CONPUDRAFT_167593 [Coniophora puteana RWD-64-598 SS2]